MTRRSPVANISRLSESGYLDWNILFSLILFLFQCVYLSIVVQVETQGYNLKVQDCFLIIIIERE